VSVLRSWETAEICYRKLLVAGRLGWMAFKGPFQPKLFYDFKSVLPSGLGIDHSALCLPEQVSQTEPLMLVSSMPGHICAGRTAEDFTKIGFLPCFLPPTTVCFQVPFVGNTVNTPQEGNTALQITPFTEPLLTKEGKYFSLFRK